MKRFVGRARFLFLTLVLLMDCSLVYQRTDKKAVRTIITGACAHRGDSKNAPENTIAAFVSAVEKGAHQIEFDVALSKDGRLVIIHDSTVDRTTNGTGKVSELTFDELRALDAGSSFDARFAGTRIPTLEETLEVIPPEILCNVHLKGTHGLGRLVARRIAAMDRLEQCFLACTVEQAQAAQAVIPAIKICNMSGQRTANSSYPDETIALGSEFIQLLGDATDPEVYKSVVQKLHQHGIKVNHCCTSDEPTIRFLIEAGVDYILTDDLDLCLNILAEYGKQ